MGLSQVRVHQELYGTANIPSELRADFRQEVTAIY
jgi:hypothetical protein